MKAKFTNYKKLYQAELALSWFNLYYWFLFKLQNIEIVSNESHVRRRYRKDGYEVCSSYTTREDFDNLKD